MTLSLIIPIFNTEIYLTRCINSILNQDNFEKYIDKIEILLINDGSPDNSHVIIETYSSKYDFIKGYSKRNGGPSDARNYGLSKANGEYIWFIDSDDWIDQTSFDTIFCEIQKEDLDILEFDSYNAIDTGNTVELRINKFYHNFTTNVISGIEVLETFGFIAGVCFKIINKNIFEKHNILFPLNEFNEDNIISFELMQNCERYKKINSLLYYYYSRQDSTTKSKSKAHQKKYYKDILNNLIRMERIIEEEKINTTMIREMQSFYTTNLLMNIIKTNNKQMIEEYVFELKKNNLYPIKPYKFHNNGFKRRLFVKAINTEWILLILMPFISKLYPK